MSVAAGDKLQIRVYCTRGDQTAINVLNYRVLANPTAMTENDIIGAFSGIVATPYKNLLAGVATFYGCDLRKWIGAALGPTFTSVAGQGAGNVVADCLPRQTCGMLRYQAATAGRHGKGRTYVAFPAESGNDSLGVPNSTYITSLLTLGTTIAGPVTVGGGIGNETKLVFTLLDRENGIWTDVATVNARNKWGVQRRRGDYGRINPPPF